MALTVGAIDRGTLVQKGQLPFVEAARELPDVRFMFAGKWLDDAVERAARAAPARTSSSPAGCPTRTCAPLYRRAAVYVQASRHEGFGLAVAEAMLAGCVPVVMNVTAMPEVVGDAGRADRVAGAGGGGRRRPARARAGAGRGVARARERILTAFPMERRRDGILEVVEDALAA